MPQYNAKAKRAGFRYKCTQEHAYAQLAGAGLTLTPAAVSPSAAQALFTVTQLT